MGSSIVPAILANLATTNALIAAINNINAAGQPGTISRPSGSWTPPNWANTKIFPIWTVTVPASSQPTLASSSSPGFSAIPIIYVFDAILRSDQEEGIRMTEFPIQTGGNISDNAYVLQNRVTLEIGMSDVHASYYAQQWTGGGSGMMQTKSVAAYTVLTNIKDARQFVTLQTRVKTYQNMLIEKITISDTVATLHGLRAHVTFRQVFTASVAAVSSTFIASSGTGGTSASASARPYATNTTATGTVSPGAPTQSIVNQSQVTTSTLENAGLTPFPTVPGAGNFSSTNVSGIATVLAGATNA
jgi:hypothetical protein